MSKRQISAGVRAKLSMCVLAALSAGGVVGCSGVGATTDLNKGFLDPTAVGRYQKQPLVVPILSSLDRSIDTDDENFRQATNVRPEDLEPGTSDYAIGRNDLVSISVTDLVAPNVETVRTNRVSESGMISMPLIGQVKAAGLTEAELEKAISKAYREANIIQNAQVSVSVAEARARTFSILGSVAQPGQYSILNSEFRLLDALVLARDVSAQGVEFIYVIRPTKMESGTGREKKPEPEKKPSEDVLTPKTDASTGSTVILAQAAPTTEAAAPMGDEATKTVTIEGKTVSVTPQPPTAVATPEAPAKSAPTMTSPAVQPMAFPSTQPFVFNDPIAEGKTRIIRVPYDALRKGDLKYNLIIKPYDMIVVPQPSVGEYYMGGHVVRVGVYSLTARKITLKQAIVSAGMFDSLALPARTDIIRRVGNDKEVFVSVDLDKVFEGSQPDVYLKPNDLVQVGTSWWAPFVAAVRGGFRMTYGFGFLYDRNWGDPTDPSFWNF